MARISPLTAPGGRLNAGRIAAGVVRRAKLFIRRAGNHVGAVIADAKGAVALDRAVIVIAETMDGAAPIVEALGALGQGALAESFSPQAIKDSGLTLGEYARALARKGKGGTWCGLMRAAHADKLPMEELTAAFGVAPTVVFVREPDAMRAAADLYAQGHLKVMEYKTEDAMPLPDMATLRVYIAQAMQKRIAIAAQVTKSSGKAIEVSAAELASDPKAALARVSAFVGVTLSPPATKPADTADARAIVRVVSHARNMARANQITMRREPRKIEGEDPLRFAVVMMVKDEEDVIYHNLTWHFALGLRQFVILDNLSTDSTRSEIERFVRLCEPMGARVIVLDDREVGYYQSRKTTSAAHLAQSYFGAEWVLALDADEFIFVDKGDIFSVLFRCEKQAERDLGIPRTDPHFFAGAQLQLVDHFCTSADNPAEANPIARLAFRRRKPKGGYKTAARWAPDLVFGQGNHNVTIRGGSNTPATHAGAMGAHIRHFPVRSFAHFLKKVRNGGRAYLNAEGLGTGGGHWKKWYELLQTEGEDALRKVFEADYVLNPADMTFDPLPGIVVERDGLKLDRQATRNKAQIELPIHGEQMVAVGGVPFSPHKISLLAPPAVGPVHLRMNTSDVPTFFQVFSRIEYDIEFPHPLRTIVDLGSNIGLAAAYFSGRYPDAKIICVEPDAGNFAMLQENIATRPNVTALHAAIWPEAGQLQVVDTDAAGKPLGAWGVQTREVAKGASIDIGGVQVEALTVHQVMQRAGFTKIDLLKVDIEGAELELFSRNTAEWLPFVESLVIETHDRFKPGTTAAVRAALLPHGYEERRSGENLVYTKPVKKP